MKKIKLKYNIYFDNKLIGENILTLDINDNDDISTLDLEDLYKTELGEDIANDVYDDLHYNGKIGYKVEYINDIEKMKKAGSLGF